MRRVIAPLFHRRDTCATERTTMICSSTRLWVGRAPQTGGSMKEEKSRVWRSCLQGLQASPTRCDIRNLWRAAKRIPHERREHSGVVTAVPRILKQELGNVARESAVHVGCED